MSFAIKESLTLITPCFKNGLKIHSTRPQWVTTTPWVHSKVKRVRSVRSMCTSEATQGDLSPVEADIGPKFSSLDIRVGFVQKCETHTNADSLYVEEVDVGENETRTICSGLVPYLSLESVLNKRVIVLCNLKARNMRGVKSHGMLLCASDKEANLVKLLVPPEEASIGDRVYLDVNQSEPDTENQMKKKKVWEQLQPLLKTNEDGVATCDGVPMKLETGFVTCPSLPNAEIS